MKISGLSNQWQSREGLFSGFAKIDPKTDPPELSEWGIKFTNLIYELENLPGPDLYIGSSLSSMNFNNRDVRHQDDRVPSFAFVEIVDDREANQMIYKISTRRIVGIRPTTEWATELTPDSRMAAKKIRDAADFADAPVRRVV